MTLPRILLFGKDGQLGWELHRCLLPMGEVLAVDFPDIDLSESESARPLIRDLLPNLIVNAAAYTAVDQAESEPALARSVNALAPAVMAEEASKCGAALIHYSTDYVFDGQTDHPYAEDDPPNPINMYGKTKYEGEQGVRSVGGFYWILRTSWLYSFRRRSFPLQVLEWARTQSVMRVVSDQVGSPTWARMLAQATALALSQGSGDFVRWVAGRTGVYHLAGEGSASRLEWAKSILELDPRRDDQVVRRVEAARRDEFPTPAHRPAFSALKCGRFLDAFGIRLPHWRDSLRLAIQAC